MKREELKACAARLATFHTWQFFERSSPLIVRYYVRYAPVSEGIREGSGYKGKKTEDQKNLEKWTEEEWPPERVASELVAATRRPTTSPMKAWKKLIPEEREAAENKKREGSKKGEQYVENTKVVREARKETAVTITGYDGLNVEEINDELEGLSEGGLDKVRSYD